MSNRVYIEPTKFVNVRSGHETFGVRVYDDEGQAYDNTWKKIPDNDLEVLEKVLTLSDRSISDMMDFCRKYKTGLYIGDTFYTWKEIADTMKEVLE